MEFRIECDNVVNGQKCGKLLFKIVDGQLEIKCRNSKCKHVQLIDIGKLLEVK